jgi:hypothetical protein
MDHDSFRDARRVLNPRPCPFERAILARCCGCSAATWLSISERETIACSDADARQACETLRGVLRQGSLFALRIAPGAPLPHAKEMKAMCGGLLGLQRVTAGETGDRSEVADVRALVRAAGERFGGALPLSAIMPSVAAFELRRRR